MKAYDDWRRDAWKKGGMTGDTFNPPLGGIDGQSGDLYRYAPNVLYLPVRPSFDRRNRRSRA